ncbi:9690_t:CDS:1 [Dentiscutata erythropus]|uniref:9690_t:CDS:1 n=1 Tax=Dentiscutata erythropus TaxID=1348616 RepID=A0A9N9BWJ4_9GLOM|nr:9690_t:CDS:1 [Dentiscutata erythropus]
MVSKLPPECLYKIFDEFSYSQIGKEKNSFTHLHSIILVNKYWCNVAIPILWRRTFNWIYQKNNYGDKHIHLMSTYISCLPEESRINLNKLGINSSIIQPTFRSNFDYPSFLQSLQYKWLYSSVNKWLDVHVSTDIIGENNETNPHPIFVEELCKLFMKRCTNLLQLSYNHLNDFGEYPIYPVVNMPSFSGASDALANLRHFDFHGCLDPNILNSAAKICKFVKVLSIACCCYDNEGLATFIDQQTHLENLSIEFEQNGIDLPKIRNSLRNKGKDLSALMIRQIFFPLDILGHSPNLTGLFIEDGCDLHRDIFGQFVNWQFFQLTNLFLAIKNVHIGSIVQLINNTCGNLTTVRIVWTKPIDKDNFNLYTETILVSCPRLIAYHGYFDDNEIGKIPEFFEKHKNLEEFHISLYSLTRCEISNMLKKLGKYLPSNLREIYLPANYVYTTESLESFLESCAAKLRAPLKLTLRCRSTIHEEILSRYVERKIIKVVFSMLFCVLLFSSIITDHD